MDIQGKTVLVLGGWGSSAPPCTENSWRSIPSD
jgi:hypothetical protein